MFRFARPALFAASIFTGAMYFSKEKHSHLSEQFQPGDHKADLPQYTRDDVRRHRTEDDEIWVTYRHGVYNITNFLENHPGGSKINAAFGGAIDPFWDTYRIHKKPEIYDMLESMRIGSLGENEDPPPAADDPYARDPVRPPWFEIRNPAPFNAETNPEMLIKNFITKNDEFYIRNHLPVPVNPEQDFILSIRNSAGEVVKTYTLDDLKKFPRHKVTSTIQCAGSRRSELKKIRPVHGLDWIITSLGTAEYEGPRLKDVLADAGLSPDDASVNHVHFKGLDRDAAGEHYVTSVPVGKAWQEEVLLATNMNGEDIPLDHGYPLRAIVPGVVGARNVKWLSEIYASADESTSLWQKRDYKRFSPSDNWDTADWDSLPAIQDMPVQSAICIADQEGDDVALKGYAYSGAGRGIAMVEVTANDGEDWTRASITNPLGYTPRQNWAWVHWDAKVEGVEEDSEICVRAIDDAYNSQPQKAEHMWNIRGVLNNSWHCVKPRKAS